MSDLIPQPPPIYSKRTDVFLLLLLLASLSLNVYLGWRVKQLNATAGGPENTFRLAPGMKVDPITAVDVDGTLHTISYETTAKPTVFYVLSPGCVWCERNQANIDRLAELRGNDFRFIGLSLVEPGLREYVQGHHLNFPMYTRLTPEAIQSLGLGSTPQTIVISPEGRVLKNWTGAYERAQPEVEAYFGVQLPGVTSGGK
jgi:hypothetical protein